MKSNADLNTKQVEALQLLRGDARYTMLFGGGGSGKSFLLCLVLITRALGIPHSTHGIFRETGVSLRNSIFNDTMKAALRTFEDGKLIDKVTFRSDPMEIEFPNGSKFLFSGLDDNERIERLFGMEYTTVWVNEVSQIKTFSPVVSTLIMRLRQPSKTLAGEDSKKRFYFDCNPPTRSHWSYKRFIKKLDHNGNPLANPDDWQCLMMNTADNKHLGADYIQQMSENLTLREQRRLIHGEFLDDTEGSLFPQETIDKLRHPIPDDPAKAEIARMRVRETLTRVVIAVDPAITNHKKSDMTGIVVCGINEAGHGYVLEDATMKGSPDQWAKTVSRLYQKWQASRVIAEDNQGGLMVENVLRSSGLANLPIKLIHAKVGKLPRAEPVSGLYETGKVHHVGYLRELEDQMTGFTYDYNPTKQGSPDRLDALVHCLTELMLEKQHAPAKMLVSTARGFF